MRLRSMAPHQRLDAAGQGDLRSAASLVDSVAASASASALSAAVCAAAANARAVALFSFSACSAASKSAPPSSAPALSSSSDSFTSETPALLPVCRPRRARDAARKRNIAMNLARVRLAASLAGFSLWGGRAGVGESSGPE